jgi:general stress protein YciG
VFTIKVEKTMLGNNSHQSHVSPAGTDTSSPDTAQELVPDSPPRPTESRADKPRRPRGFAAMDRALVSEIARKGGKAAHTAGTAHEFTAEEAREAGRKGGKATHARRRGSEAPAPSKATEPHTS